MERRIENEAKPLKELEIQPTSNELMITRTILRSTNYNLDKPLFEIGQRKKFFLCSGNNGQMLLTLFERDFSKYDKESLKSLLKLIKHPLLEPTEGIEMDDKKLVFIRKFSDKGSLRDFIYRSSPMSTFTNKYKTGTPLLPKYISFFGKQILLGIKCLEGIGLKMRVKTANIIYYGSQIKLSEFENEILRFPHDYEKFTKGSEILSFGHVLYEMATGVELNSNKLHSTEKFPIQKDCLLILQKIFDGQYGNVDMILEEKFFSVEMDASFKDSILGVTQKMKVLYS